MTTEGNGIPGEGNVSRIRALGESLGLKIENVVRSGELANTLGIQTDYLLVSQRLDSQTYFVQDKRFNDGSEGLYEGSDEELIDTCRSILSILRIPADEFGDFRVIREHRQSASYDPASGRTEVEPAEEGQRHAQLNRVVSGHPVWDSGVVLGLRSSGEIGFLQVHWPKLQPDAIDRVSEFADRLLAGWEAPECPGATFESSIAGIAHSPAVASVMDIYPVIRVIYAPRDSDIGRKPVRYVDLEGKEIPAPRNHDWNLEEILPPNGERKPQISADPKSP